MELTWLAIASSIVMGLAAVCVFIFAVKKNLFHNIEDAKYQVFWSDLDEHVESPATAQEKRNAGGSKRSR